MKKISGKRKSYLYLSFIFKRKNKKLLIISRIIIILIYWKNAFMEYIINFNISLVKYQEISNSNYYIANNNFTIDYLLNLLLKICIIKKWL